MGSLSPVALNQASALKLQILVDNSPRELLR
ncbi:MAG: hypothetical protein ACI9K9_001576, partial [Neolewinella sp.]